jgi:hypothetical protein
VTASGPQNLNPEEKKEEIMQRQIIGAKAGVMTACLLMIASIASIPARADTIGITYSFAGAPTAPPVLTGTTLTLDGLANGSILSGNPGLDAIWNPVTFHTHNVVDVTNGLNNGSFSMTFANGDMLSGNLFEDDSAVLATNTGPFTQTLTFTGGTGEFAGATGSVSGEGVIGTTGFSVSGSGTVTAAGISAVPEQASVVLIVEGLLVMVAGRKLVRQQG